MSNKVFNRNKLTASHFLRSFQISMGELTTNEKKKLSSITFVTGNANKIAETRAILEEHFELGFKNIDLPEYQGDSDFICIEKAKCAASLINAPVVIEDSCLSFNALNGLPGAYIKWFYEKLGCEGLYQLLAAYPDKTAVATCTMAFSEGPMMPVKLFRGEAQGVITPPRGTCGFGWDPIFLPNGSVKTFAEITSKEKNEISHRKKSILLFKDYLQSKYCK